MRYVPDPRSAPMPCPHPARSLSGPMRGPGLLLVAALALAACREEAPATTSRFPAFGGQADLSLVGVAPAQAERAAAEVRADFQLMERDWNPWAPGPMGRVNALLPKGEPFVAPPSLLPLLRLSQGFSEQSKGLFNPAIGGLVELWGFNAPLPECHPPPNERTIRRLVAANPQIGDVRIDGLEIATANPAVKLDLGAIARGYAIDLAIEHLRELGVRDASVQIGGELRAIGDRSGQPWRVPVRRASGSGVLGVLMVRGDEAVAAKLAADRSFVYGGINYHSVLDPRTGWPAKDVLAVTVAHGSAATAAAAAAALFVAGPEGWHPVARAMGVRYVLLVDGRGRLHLSPEMQGRIALMDESAELVVSPPLGPEPEATPSPRRDGLAEGGR